MIILAESNFVLELALQQKQVDDAECIVKMAEGRRIQLAIPACCLFEPYETIIRRKKQRTVARSVLACELQQLARCRRFAGFADSARSVVTGLKSSDVTERKALDETVHRLLRCCVVCALTDVVVEGAKEAENRFGLTPQDAMVFASVHEHAARHAGVQKVFVSTDQTDFSKDVVPHLAALDCKVLHSFTSARQYAESQAGRA